jgi:hypothetical protein
MRHYGAAITSTGAPMTPAHPHQRSGQGCAAWHYKQGLLYFMVATKEAQAAELKVSAGPAGSLESRTATP